MQGNSAFSGVHKFTLINLEQNNKQLLKAADETQKTATLTLLSSFRERRFQLYVATPKPKTGQNFVLP